VVMPDRRLRVKILPWQGQGMIHISPQLSGARAEGSEDRVSKGQGDDASPSRECARCGNRAGRFINSPCAVLSQEPVASV